MLIAFSFTLALTGCSASMAKAEDINESNLDSSHISSASSSYEAPSSPAEQKAYFLSKLNEVSGVEGTLNFAFHLSDKDEDATTENLVQASGATFRFAKATASAPFALSLSAVLDYNGVSKDLACISANRDAYFAFAGLRYCYHDSTYRSLIGKIISIFGADALKVPSSFYDFLDSFMNPSDEQSLNDLDWQEENGEEAHQYVLKSSSFGSVLFATDEDYNLTKVSADSLTIKNAKFSFSFYPVIKTNILTTIQEQIPTDASAYTELYDASELVRRIHEITTNPRFGIAIDGNIHRQIAETNRHVASEEDIPFTAALNFDFDRSHFDGEMKFSSTDSNSTISFFSEVKEEKRINYLDYNDALKVAVTNSVLEEVIQRYEADHGTVFSLLDRILDLLDGEVAHALKSGRYESIAKAIKTLSNQGNHLVCELDLGVLGFDEGSFVQITLDGTKDHNLLSVNIVKAGISGTNLTNTSITMVGNNEKTFDSTSYYSLTKLPSLYDQFSSLYHESQFHLTFDGSYRDQNGVGLSSFSGSANAAAESQTGTDGKTTFSFKAAAVDLDLIQQIGVYGANQSFSSLGEQKNHHITLDLEGKESAYFHYYDAGNVNASKKDDGTWGKLSLKPFDDVVSIVKEIMNCDDERFNKWFKVVEATTASTVMAALKQGQISPFLNRNLIVSSSFDADQVVLTFSGRVFGLAKGTEPNNFTVTLHFQNDQISSLSISDLEIGEKTLNLTLTISALKEEHKTAILNHSDAFYTDFTGIAPLARDLYSTAQLKTFHLTGTQIGAKILFFSLYLDADFRIYVDGSIVKVYGILNVPCILGVNGGSLFTKYYRTVTLYYDDIDPNTGKAYEDNSGYLYLTYNVSKTYGQQKGGTYGAYRYHSSYFLNDDGGLNSDHLQHFIFKDVLGMSDTIYNQIASSDSSDTAGKAIDYESVITQFAYTESARQWKVGINLEKLTNLNQLKTFNATLVSSQSSANDNRYVFSQFDFSLEVSLLITIDVTGTLKNVDLDQADNWSSVNAVYQSYIDTHRNDKINYQ